MSGRKGHASGEGSGDGRPPAPSSGSSDSPSSSGSVPDDFSADDVLVRALREADLVAVAPMLALAAASGLPTPAPIVGRDRDADDDLSAVEHDEYWLAEHDGRVIGFTLLHHVDPQRAAIRTLWIDERFRRRGVGQRLLEGTVVHCQRAGYLKLVLELPFSLDKMVPLFGRLGFSFARRRDISGSTMLEFYLDLYREPGL